MRKGVMLRRAVWNNVMPADPILANWLHERNFAVVYGVPLCRSVSEMSIKKIKVFEIIDHELKEKGKIKHG